CGQATHRPPTF
nr:immunoglobulin light chain junction region [Macaca mulatta]